MLFCFLVSFFSFFQNPIALNLHLKLSLSAKTIENDEPTTVTNTKPTIKSNSQK